MSARATGRPAGTCEVLIGTTWRVNPGTSWQSPGFNQTDRDPVVCVSWDDAQAYAGWLAHRTGQAYRLPTEAEWEYAGRGGTTTARYWGETLELACENANVADFSALAVHAGWRVVKCQDGFAETSPVGQFRPNAFGIYDVLGNVLQWTQDCFHNSYVTAPTDGSAWTTGNCSTHMARGSSFANEVSGVRTAARTYWDTDARIPMLGFRIARSF